MSIFKQALSTLLAGAIGGLVTYGIVRLADKPQTVVVENSPAPRQVNYGGPAYFDFTKAAERAMSTVVHIKATESRPSMRQRQQHNPLRYFFGDIYESYNQPKSGTGSGVIYTSDGYILTNNHVIDFADEVTVTLHDNREFKARIVGRDENTDMAVIKIDADHLSAIELGNSDDVKVGEWVLAVGNPFDLSSTVTAGIVSAKGRDIRIIKRSTAIESFIQTDAAVNPGNSGGALVDVQGRLIGINSAIASPTGAFAGYSFAIPVNLVKRIADDLIKYGEYRRAYLGVDVAPLDASLASELDIPLSQGVVIMGLDESGSAAQSGLKQYDVITRINNKAITGLPELREIIGRSQIGDVLKVTVVRNNKEREVQVKLRSRNMN